MEEFFRQRLREGNPQNSVGKVQDITEYNEWSQLRGWFCVWIGRDRSVTGGGPGEGAENWVLQGLGYGLEGGWG